MSKVLQKGSTLQYFQPPLSFRSSLRYLFCLFLSGRFSQVLLYCVKVCVAVLLAVFDLLSALCAYNPLPSFENTVKPVLSGHSKRTPKQVFNTNYRLMQVKIFCRMLQVGHSAILSTFIKLPFVIKIFAFFYF